MSILMEDTDYPILSKPYMARYPTPKEEEAMKLLQSAKLKLKAKRVSTPKQSISIDAGRMF